MDSNIAILCFMGFFLVVILIIAISVLAGVGTSLLKLGVILHYGMKQEQPGESTDYKLDQSKPSEK